MNKAEIEREYLTEQEAWKFFAELYFGEHHVPKGKLYRWGSGWMVKDDTSTFATYDYDRLTRFVLMCHRDCIRGEIRPHAFRDMKVIIHKRKGRDCGFTTEHPTIEKAIDKFLNQSI